MTSQPQPQPPAWSCRLADQLQLLSEVAESLTYRMLELEERLAAQEPRLLEPADGVDPQLAEEMELRLLETEERLARIEGLLGAEEVADAGRHLQPVRPAGRTGQASGAEPVEAEIPQEDPFLDEGEQPFMDELIA